MPDNAPYGTLRPEHPTSRDVPTLIYDSRAWVEAEHYDRLHVAQDEVIADLCALVEEQDGNPHDEMSTRLYEMAHKLVAIANACPF